MEAACWRSSRAEPEPKATRAAAAAPVSAEVGGGGTIEEETGGGGSIAAETTGGGGRTGAEREAEGEAERGEQVSVPPPVRVGA